MFLAFYVLLMLLITSFKEKLYIRIRKYSIFLLLPIIALMLYAMYYSVVVLRDYHILHMCYWALISVILALVFVVLAKVKDSKYQYMIFLAAAICFIIAGFGPLSERTVVNEVRTILKYGPGGCP